MTRRDLAHEQAEVLKDVLAEAGFDDVRILVGSPWSLEVMEGRHQWAGRPAWKARAYVHLEKVGERIEVKPHHTQGAIASMPRKYGVLPANAALAERLRAVIKTSGLGEWLVG